jgi:hypothetical protein
MTHLDPCDIDAFVNLHMWANSDPIRFGTVGHKLHILVEEIFIDDHTRRGQNVLSDIAEVPSSNSSV